MNDSGGFTCPVCGRTSHNPNDVREGYCGNCHDWTGTPARAKPDYFAEHGEDMMQVKLIDLACVAARLRQVRDGGAEEHPVVYDRLFTCDLPRLLGYLPDAAVEAMDE